MLVNAFVECQRTEVCVRVGVLQPFYQSDPCTHGWAFGLSPKFSTPVEKPVEIRVFRLETAKNANEINPFSPVEDRAKHL